jgi:hypothetical protein
MGQACKFQYNQSLFVRLQKHHPDAVHLLRYVEASLSLSLSLIVSGQVYNIECILISANCRVACFTKDVCKTIQEWLSKLNSHGIRILSLERIVFSTFRKAKNNKLQPVTP